MAPELLEQFEAETGIKVNYDTFDSLEMLETKLLTGNTGYDVVVPSAPFLQRQVAAGVYQPIDRARLPHYGSLDPEMMAMLAVNDPGNAYGVGFMWGTTGIASRARLRAQEAKRESDIRYTIPVEGTLSWGDAMAIPKDAPHPDAAHAFIDFLLRPDAGARLAEFVRYATFNRAALVLLDDEITGDESIYPPPDVRARLRLTQARIHEQTRIENRIWTRFRTGQ
jgi:spermidine/putrescine-binding protein